MAPKYGQAMTLSGPSLGTEVAHCTSNQRWSDFLQPNPLPSCFYGQLSSSWPTTDKPVADRKDIWNQSVTRSGVSVSTSSVSTSSGHSWGQASLKHGPAKGASPCQQPNGGWQQRVCGAAESPARGWLLPPMEAGIFWSWNFLPSCSHALRPRETQIWLFPPNIWGAILTRWQGNRRCFGYMKTQQQ